MDVVGERALIVRGKDGVVRGFHNLCRHRGQPRRRRQPGHLQERAGLPVPRLGLQSRRHAARRGPSALLPRARQDRVRPDAARPRNLDGLHLLPLPQGPQPSVAELLKPIEAEIAHYQSAEMVPSWGIWTQKTPVNWKSVRDVDNEGYHVAMAHPALQDLYGATYFDEPFVERRVALLRDLQSACRTPLERARNTSTSRRSRRICRRTCARPGSTTASSRTW